MSQQTRLVEVISRTGTEKESLFERFHWLYAFCREHLFRDDTEQIANNLGLMLSRLCRHAYWKSAAARDSTPAVWPRVSGNCRSLGLTALGNNSTVREGGPKRSNSTTAVSKRLMCTRLVGPMPRLMRSSPRGSLRFSMNANWPSPKCIGC